MQNLESRSRTVLHSAFFVHHLRKAGRYKLAAPCLENRTGTTGARALLAPSAKILTLNERRSHEASYSISKHIALSQELQAKSINPNQTFDEVEIRVSTGRFWIEAKIQNRPV